MPAEPALRLVEKDAMDKTKALDAALSQIERSFGSPGEIGRLFLTDHLIAFEITSIVLLVAAVGGVILGSHAQDEPSLKDADARA